MTDRSSEERSRFEKWWESEIEEAVAGMVAKSYARDAWMARAALEDRQEAPMDQDTQEAYNSLNVARYHELQDLRRKFTDPELKEHAIQLGAISMAGMNADLWSTRQKLAAYLEQNFRPRVPSEATPSKEKETVAALRELNFALAEEVARLGKKSGPRVIAAQSKLDRLDWTASDQVFTGPTPEMQAVRRKYHEAAPAPEVQGTPTSISAESASPLQLAAESTAPVGTPQKETPPMTPQSSCKKCGLQMTRITVGMVYRCLNCDPLPSLQEMKDAVKVRVDQYKARIPCGNCGHVHLGCCSVCDPPGCEQIVPPAVPVPEGVQGMPQNWRALPVGQWFFMDSPDCESRYSVQERTSGGCSIVCSTPYIHEGAANDMKEIARLHNQSSPHNENSALPVGAPQKETPQISEEVAAWRNLYPSAEFSSVPEGVQGKEPQFEDDGIFTDPFSETAYRAGEAAGRRSAITEIQEWILTVREDPFDLWSAGYNKGFDAVSKKCAELQEKTK